MEEINDMKNKILFLVHLPPPVHGSSMVGLMIKENSKINSKFDCNYINLLASQNLAESGVVNFKKLKEFLFTFQKVLATILRKRPNLCYLALTTTGPAFFRDFLLIALLKAFRIKRIYHLHNKGISRYQNKKIYQFCYNFVFRNAEVILLSKQLYPDLQKFVPLSKIHICPNGIPDLAEDIYTIGSQIYEPISFSNQQDSSENQVEISKSIIQILFLSNLIESKGVYDLLNACVILNKKKIAFKCIFIGGESDISESQFNNRVNQLGLSQQVIYLGKKYGNEKKLAYMNADIFVFPTYYSNECFPLVVLEAMSFCLPVITTSEGGIQDIVEDGRTGFLIVQKDVTELANKLENLIENPDMIRQMGAAGRKKYEQEYTLEKFETRLTEILYQVIVK